MTPTRRFTTFRFRAPRQLRNLAVAGALAAMLATAPGYLGLSAQHPPLGPTDGHDLHATDLERVSAGIEAPLFALESFGGEIVELAGFRDKQNVVLVFYRGHWWPYCARQLGELRDLLPPALAAETVIVAVSVDDREKQQLMIDRIVADGGEAPDFVMLSDPDHRVIDRYGLLNPDAPPNRPVPHPATYVIDKDGVVRWGFVEEDYRVRPANADILAVLEAL